MEDGKPHKVLVVDDEALITRTISKICRVEKIKCIAADSGDAALEILQQAKTPFSIIITDQRMPGMKGTQLLEKARQISPDTQRFLITGFSEINTIIEAVNKGAIQQYIQKPWDHDSFIDAIHTGLRHFEDSMEHEKLLSLAKKQNAKLYDLNCQLMEETTTRDNEQKNLEEEIKDLEHQIEKLNSGKTADLSELTGQIENELGVEKTADPIPVQKLFYHTIRVLFDQFNDTANRNGFEMPLPKGRV